MAETNLIRGEMKPTTRPFRADLVGLATKRDMSALRTMFQQFCGEDDEILTADYLGLRGLWHIGMHSFICLTKSRICAIEVGWLGRVVYAEGYLEDFNSGQIVAPTLLLLYFISVIVLFTTLGFGVIILPFVVRLYYRYFKCGAFVNFRQGQPIHIFCNRRDLIRLTRYWRRVDETRDARISFIRRSMQ